MGSDTLTQINWVDILVVIIVIRTGYIAMKKGSFIELFKLLGVILGIYLSLHYYTRLADIFESIINKKAIPVELWDFLSFIILVILGSLILFLFREGLAMFIKVEVVTLVDKWTAAILGIARGVLLASLIIYVFSIPVIDYSKKSIGHSSSGKYLLNVSPTIYRIIWDNVMSKFTPKEKFNESILEIQKDYSK